MPQTLSFQPVISRKIISEIFYILRGINLQNLVCIYFVLSHVSIGTCHIASASEPHTATVLPSLLSVGVT